METCLFLKAVQKGLKNKPSEHRMEKPETDVIKYPQMCAFFYNIYTTTGQRQQITPQANLVHREKNGKFARKPKHFPTFFFQTDFPFHIHSQSQLATGCMKEETLPRSTD